MRERERQRERDRERDRERQRERERLTVRSGESAAESRHRGAATHYELVRLTLVVRGLRLGQDHVVHVESDDNHDKVNIVI